VYSGQSQTQTVFEEVAERVVLNAIEGFSGCIFCYGQTGSGKTWTMHGHPKHSPGLVSLGVQTLFTYMEEAEDKQFLVRCSYVEIYNECVNDLLNPNATNLKVMEHRSKKVVIQGLTESVCSRIEQVQSLLQLGESSKQVASTNFNQRSSRSHTLFRLVLESKDDAERDVVFSSVNFIDLAGSECASAHNFGDSPASVSRKREMSCINKSLLTLSTVIMRLSDENNSAPIPFRESKLTRLLKDALEVEAKISIICTISPTPESFEEALNTLKFAMKAKKIKQTISKTVPDSSSLLLKYQHEIDTLRQELQAMETRIEEEAATNTAPLIIKLETLDQELQNKDFENLELSARLDAMNERLTVMTNEKLEIQMKLEHLTQQIVRAESLKRGKAVEVDDRENVETVERVQERVRSFRRQSLLKSPCRSAHTSAKIDDFQLSMIQAAVRAARKDSDSLSSESSESTSPVHVEHRKLRLETVLSLAVPADRGSEVETLRKIVREKDEIIAKLARELKASKARKS